MKKLLLTLLLASASWLTSASDIRVDVGNVRIDAPGVSITFGSRNDRGYYWDGREWRDAAYWKKHQGPRGEKYYTGRSAQGVPHQGPGFCPPGQAKKGNC